jgi:hypothetical protein
MNRPPKLFPARPSDRSRRAFHRRPAICRAVANFVESKSGGWQRPPL